ncbi:MAG: C40 family peptidase [Gallionella sp.]
MRMRMSGRNSRIFLNLSLTVGWRRISTNFVACVLLALLCSACTSTRDSSQAYTINSLASIDKLTSYAKNLIGTPYRYGGSSPSEGFDCSGFVRYVFKRTAGISLPHNSNQISRHGRLVKSSQLRKGDLVFYNTSSQPNSHLGIYLGNNRFIHAPSSGGRVRIEDMNISYWEKRYNGARRITLKR